MNYRRMIRKKEIMELAEEERGRVLLNVLRIQKLVKDTFVY